MRTRMLSYVLGLLASVAVIPLAFVVLRSGVEIPFWDEWSWAILIDAAHHNALTFQQLWEPHGEHRIFLANVFLIVLDRFAGWSVVREQIISLVLLALTQLFVWSLIRRTVPRDLRGVAFALSTLLMLGLSQSENFSWGFQIGWFFCNLALVAAVWWLTRSKRSFVDVALAMIAATLASLTSSQGVVVWLAGAVAILMVPRRVRFTLALWVAAAVCVALLVRPGSSSPDAGVHVGLHLGLIVTYVLLYLGSPIAASLGHDGAIAAGLCAVILLAVAVYLAFSGTLLRRVRLAPWISIAVYAVTCGALTALSRAELGVDQAMSSRYTTISMLLWVALCAAACIGLRNMLRRNMARSTRVVVGVALVLLVAGSLEQSRAGLEAWVYHTQQLRKVVAELSRGETQDLWIINPGTRHIALLMGHLAEVEDGPFRR